MAILIQKQSFCCRIATLILRVQSNITRNFVALEAEIGIYRFEVLVLYHSLRCAFLQLIVLGALLSDFETLVWFVALHNVLAVQDKSIAYIESAHSSHIELEYPKTVRILLSTIVSSFIDHIRPLWCSCHKRRDHLGVLVCPRITAE